MNDQRTEVGPAVPPFCVLLGPDYAGKSSVLTELARIPSRWRFVSLDKEFLGHEHSLIPRLRKDLVTEVIPALGHAYSPDFAMTLMQTAVVHLRDQLRAGDPDQPVVIDSYYYKILAKCRLVVSPEHPVEHPMFAWWRSFPQPRRVVYLHVPPETAWLRSEEGAVTNCLEHYGERPSETSFLAFQSDLQRVMWEEIRDLPVTVFEEQGGPADTAQAIRKVLSHELD